MKSFLEVKNAVLKKIKPSIEEYNITNSIVNEFKSKIESELLDIEFFLGGSFSKDTWLSKSKDIDVFLRFDKKKYFGKDISKIAYNILKKHFDNVVVLHGSRNYFNIVFKNLNFEVIPVFKINSFEEKENIMDVSPLHVLYVNKNLKNKDDVRFLKYFLKQNFLYGAESYIQGFSGYVCELLIIYYDTVENFFENVLEWKDEVFIDIENYYNNILEAKKVLKDKWNCLTIVDPVQKDRNASKGLDKKNFEKFKILVKNFYKNPSLKFFEVKKKVLKKPYFKIFLEGKNNKKDVSASMLKKIVFFILKSAEKEGFLIEDFFYEYDEEKNVMVLNLKTNFEIKKLYKGPNLKFKSAVENFKKKHEGKECFVKNNIIYCFGKKISFENFLLKLSKDKGFLKRAKLKKVQWLE